MVIHLSVILIHCHLNILTNKKLLAELFKDLGFTVFPQMVTALQKRNPVSKWIEHGRM